MKKRNIYQKQSQELLSLFEGAGSSAKVMCVPMDYAKKDHMVMFCNGHGDILCKPFSVKNSPDGIEYLIDQVTRTCLRRGIKKENVFLGGEDANSFAENFVNTLRFKGWLVAGVNDHDGKTYTGHVAKRCNRILKDYVVKSAYHLGLSGPEDLMADYKRRDVSGQHADFGIGRRYLRMAMRLMRTSQIYLPPRLRRADTAPEERAVYYLTSWPILRDKWKKAGALEAVFSKDRPLGLWRQIVQKLYDITLKL